MVVLVSGDDFSDPRIEFFIKFAAVEMIGKYGAILFYIRNCGQFQSSAMNIIRNLPTNIKLYTPFVAEKFSNKPCYNNPAVHSFNEKKLPGYDPHKKDIYMLEACDSLITNISNPESDSAKLTELALKKNFTVINVLKYNNLLSKPHKKDNLF